MSRAVWPNFAAVYLVACLLLGGASAAGAVANAILQFLAVLLLLALLWTRRAELPDSSRGLVLIVALFLALGLASLIPLPHDVWKALPAREEIAGALAALGAGEARLPLSLSPSATIASLLYLLPPAAMFLLAVRLSGEERRRLQGAMVAVALFSVALGAFQLLGGRGSPLRFYEVTNPESPVGLFANVNHQATLLLCALPFTAAMAARASSERSRPSKRSAATIVSAATAAFLTLGIALTGSMAAYGLFIFAACASILVWRRATAGRVGGVWIAALGAAFLLFVGASVAGPIGEQQIAGELSTDPASRRTLAATTLQAIERSFPAGTGLGSFQDIYRRFEDPALVTPVFTNRAHNDYLEATLELGLGGALLILAFIFWWARRSFDVWRNDFKGANLARAGSVAIGVVLVHSIVDYPIRTSAIAAVLAVSCAFLLRTPQPRQETSTVEPMQRHKSNMKHLSADQ